MTRPADPTLDWRLKALAPRTTDPVAWARYNQWAAEQRTLNNQTEKETKP